MNENNTNQNEIKVNALKIISNKDGSDTYSIELETTAHNIFYPKTNVVFGVSQSIAFPIAFQVLDNKDKIMFTYSLNLQQNGSTNHDDAEHNAE